MAVGLPFNHTVVWLYVLPPGVLTWLTTRPVIESKRLPELVTSQLRYLAEPRIWCRMAPFAEKDEIQFVVRVWRRQPSRRPQPAPAHETAVPVPAVPVPAAGKAPEAPPAPTAGTAAAAARAAAAAARVLVRQRAAARPRPAGRDRGRGAVRPPARHTGSSGETPPDPGMLEVSHDADPGSPVPPAPPSWPSLPAVGAAPPAPGPRAGSSPHPGPRAGSSPQAAPHAEPEPPSEPVPAAVPPPAAGTPAWRETPAHLTPARSVAARVAARFLELDREDRPLPSVQRALSGPGSGGETWRRRVKVVAGGRGERDRETLDRGRARLPLPGPRRIVVLGCTEGAGQTVTALMTGRLLAAIRDAPVAALDLNPGPAGLAARSGPVASVASLLAAAPPRRDDARPAARLDVIAGPDGRRALDADGYRRVADLLAAWYPLTLIDPAPAELTRVLPVADQLLLVVPASPDAATSLASTQQWLAAHGYRELAGRAVTVINGVSGRTGRDVLEAESVARGRCRAIVRVPWDDQVAAPRPPAAKARPAPPLQPQTRTAYTALAGVLVAGMAALPAPAVPGGSSGEPAD